MSSIITDKGELNMKKRSMNCVLTACVAGVIWCSATTVSADADFGQNGFPEEIAVENALPEMGGYYAVGETADTAGTAAN